MSLERQVCEVMHLMDLLDKFVGAGAPGHRFQEQGQVSHDCRTWHDSGDEGGAAGVCGGHVGDQGAGYVAGGGGP